MGPQRTVGDSFMLRATFALIFLAFVSGCDTTPIGPTDTGPSTPDIFPSVMVQSCDGTASDLLDIVTSHDVTYITFGAKWCTACKEEVPIINDKVVAQFDATRATAVQVLVEDDPGDPPTGAVCEDWADTLKPEFTLLTDPNQNTVPIFFASGITTLPMHLVVTKDKTIQYIALGPMGDDLTQLITDWLP